MTYANRIMIVGPADETYQASKTPDEILDYGFDWSRILRGDTITASDWDTDGLSQPSASSIDGGKAIVWLAGGAAGAVHSLVNTVTTSGGRHYQRSICLRVASR